MSLGDYDSNDYSRELDQGIRELEHELRKYEPSDGEMMQRLGMLLAIKEAAELLRAVAPDEQRTDDRWHGRRETWLALPVVAQARRMP